MPLPELIIRIIRYTGVRAQGVYKLYASHEAQRLRLIARRLKHKRHVKLGSESNLRRVHGRPDLRLGRRLVLGDAKLCEAYLDA